MNQIKVGGFDKDLCIVLDLTGDYNLKAEVCAQIKVDSITQQIALTSPKIEVLDGDASVSMAVEVLEGYILELIEEEVQLDLTGVFNSIPVRIYKVVVRGKSGDKVNVLVEEMNVSISDYVVHEEEIEIQLQAIGRATVGIEKLKKN